jgi:hypothetical protein
MKISIKMSIPVLLVLFLFLGTINAFAVSTSVKSEKDYYYSLNTLRSLNIMVENFPEGEVKEKYDKVRKLFTDASEAYYGREFNKSWQQFRKIKFDLIDLLEVITDSYLKRTKAILDSTREKAFDALIKYSRKNSNFVTYLKKPFDPLNDVKPYSTDKFHFFYNGEKIERYLKSGYEHYHQAKNFRNDPEIEMLKKRKYLTPNGQNFIIDKYMNAIFICRQAKKLGIEIHKIMNNAELQKSLKEFGVSSNAMDPIFDYRIPEEYKIDANDNIGLIHEVEIKRYRKRTENGN